MNKIIIFSLVCLSFLITSCGSNNNNGNNTIETPISKTINGYGEPSDDIGNDGDIYVNQNTGDTYTKSNGKWTLTKKGNYKPYVPPTNPEEPSEPSKEPSEPSIDNIITFNQTSFYSLPEKLRTHNLTTEDVRNIKDIDDAKGKISSISDAILYFQTIKIRNYSSIGIHDNNPGCNVIYYYFDLSKMIDSVSYFDSFSFNASQYYLAYLLSDNFEDSGLLYGFERNGLVEDNICFGTYFKIENKYHVLFNKSFGSTNCLNDYSSISYYYYAVDNLDEIKDLYRGFKSNGLYALVKDIANPKSEVILSNTKFILSGTGTQLYLDNEYLKNLITISESKLSSDMVNTFRLPTELGKQTLTSDEARYLAYKPLDYIKSKIKNLADLVLFYFANYFKSGEHDIQCFDNFGVYWHYNRCPQKIIRDCFINCGGVSNLTKFLLDDVYDEVGMLSYTFEEGFGGGHVTNYFKYNNKYYFVDFTGIIASHFSYNLDIVSFNSFDEYVNFYINKFKFAKVIMTGEYKDGYDLPISWSSDMKTTYCPTGSTYKTLYLADGYQVKELPMNMELNRYGFPDRYNKINEHSINNNLVYQLGIPLLSQFDLEELCKKSIDEVAAKVNTLADLLNYMTVKGICTYEGDMKAILSDKKCWQFNRNAKTVNKTKFADCGGSANFANYLLKGDYDEVGYIDYTFGFGKGGGHVTNYLKKGNLYFFYDLTSWLTNYNINYFIINSFTNMDQYATWASTNHFYKNSNLIASFVADNDLPINWDDLDQEITYYDSSYKLNVILARNGAKFIPLDISNEDKARIDYRRDID